MRMRWLGSAAWFLLTTLLIACVTFMDPGMGQKFSDALHGSGSSEDQDV
jgi:hypothetical protein